MQQTIILSENQVTSALHEFINTCDGDELAGLCGDVFGGQCTTIEGEIYRFTPNQNYSGAFDLARKKKRK